MVIWQIMKTGENMNNAEKARATYEAIQTRKRARKEGKKQADTFLINNTLKRKKESRC